MQRALAMAAPIPFFEFILLVLGLMKANGDESSKKLSISEGNEFIKALNSERAKAKGGAKSMGCLTWSDGLAEEAKKVAETCFVDSPQSTYGYLKKSWRGNFDQYLSVPNSWSTSNQNFNFEKMECAINGWCDDFQQSMYYKRGKIGCAYNTKCGTWDYTLVCAFEHKIPGNVAPYEVGTQCSSCALGEKCTVEHCCDVNDNKNENDGKDSTKANLIPLYRFVRKIRRSTVLKTSPEAKAGEISYGIFGYVASSIGNTDSCGSLKILREWKRANLDRVYTLGNEVPEKYGRRWKKGEVLGYVSAFANTCGADTPVHHYTIRSHGSANFYTTTQDEFDLIQHKSTYLDQPFYIWGSGPLCSSSAFNISDSIE